MYVKQEVSNTIIIDKSRFICYLKHVESEEEYKEYLSFIRKKHYDCSHVCSALILGNTRRSSDDGEPSGTAGAPILNALEKNNIDETCALVVRYFGGIKLGAGGLIRAYGGSVIEALKQAVLAEDAVVNRYALTVSYDVANKIQYFLTKNTAGLEIKYDEEVTFSFCLEDEKLIPLIEEYTRGVSPVFLHQEKMQRMV